jgi:proteasome lid subunit RPN8/RPN11
MYAHIFTTLLYLGAMEGDLAHDPVVRKALWQLMEESRYGFSETEEAMFIVRGRDGRFSFVRWTSLHLPHHARWTAAVPRGVVAIAHTHPNWKPNPSAIDVRTATRTNLAVYVVTRTRITKASAVDVRTIVRGEWRP